MRTAVKIPKGTPFEQAIPLIIQRLFERRSISATGCWEWTGFKSWLGYGETAILGKPWRVHRLAYRCFKGEFDRVLDVCHSCDNRACFNPDHLWLGTHKQNMDDHVAKGRHYEARRETCERGHPLSGDNLYVSASKKGNGVKRGCKMCQLGHHRVRAGWPEDLAFSLPAMKRGERPAEAGNPQYRKRT